MPPRRSFQCCVDIARVQGTSTSPAAVGQFTAKVVPSASKGGARVRPPTSPSPATRSARKSAVGILFVRSERALNKLLRFVCRRCAVLSYSLMYSVCCIAIGRLVRACALTSFSRRGTERDALSAAFNLITYSQSYECVPAALPQDWVPLLCIHYLAFPGNGHWAELTAFHRRLLLHPYSGKSCHRNEVLSDRCMLE